MKVPVLYVADAYAAVTAKLREIVGAGFSPGVFPLAAIQAGIPKNNMPSGIPCAIYKVIKLKYRKKVFSESEGIDLVCFNGIGVVAFISTIFLACFQFFTASANCLVSAYC